MDLSYRKVKTSHGVPLDQFLSCIQKAIRHGNKDQIRNDALDIVNMFQLEQDYRFRKVQVPEGRDPEEFAEDRKKKTISMKSIMTNILHRIMKTYLEDVHFGEPAIWPWINEKMKILFSLREKLDSDEEFKKTLTNVLLVLCHSNHSRGYSFLRRAFHSDGSLCAPYEVQDKLPSQFKQVIDFFDPKCKLPYYDVDGVDLKFWKEHITGQENFLVGAASSLHKILMYRYDYDAKNSRINNIMMELEGDSRKLELKDVMINRDTKFSESPFVLDCHTKTGKSLPNNEGDKRFITLGSNVVNEVHVLHPVFQRHYVISKWNESAASVDEKLPRETNDLDQLLTKSEYFRNILKAGYSERVLFHPIVRAQVTCSAHRGDTYFALFQGFQVLVKGPFLKSDAEAVKKQMWYQKNIKSKLDGISDDLIPWECNLIPDQFGGSVPLGSRNLVDKNEPQLFFVWRSLIPDSMWPIPTKLKTTKKKWMNEKVVDWYSDLLYDHIRLPDIVDMDSSYRRHTHDNPHLKSKAKKSIINFLLSMGLRYISGIPDNAERNFIWTPSDSKVYSVDEDRVFTHPSPFRFKKQKRDLIKINIGKFWEEMSKSLVQWKNVFNQFSDEESYGVGPCLKRLAEISTMTGFSDLFNDRPKKEKKRKNNNDGMEEGSAKKKNKSKNESTTTNTEDTMDPESSSNSDSD